MLQAVVSQECRPVEHLSTEWRDAFVAQGTAATLESVKEFVRVKLAYLFGAWCDETPAELIHDALADTYTGLVTWNPSRVSLARHLVDRVWQVLMRKRSRAAKFVRMDYVSDHDPESGSLDAALAYSVDFVGHLDRRIERNLVTRVWMAAAEAGDLLAVAYMNARLIGLDQTDAIAEALGCTPAEVKATRLRLTRLRHKLPAEVRAMIQQWAA